MAASIDLNADLGEECGDDAAMLDLVSSASVAAGGHAGGGEVLCHTVRLAADRGVQVGAHVSYPDREGFGRRSWRGRDLTGLADELVGQVVAVADAAQAVDVRVHHVKAHGALYNDATVDPAVAAVLAGALSRLRELGHPAVAATLGVFAPAASVMSRACGAVPGVHPVAEVFADRAYLPDATLVPRTEPGAVLTDATVIADRAVVMVRDGRTNAHDGSELSLSAQTLCIHGDTPDAVAHARALVRALSEAGITVRAWSS
jgi:UPF0271 protein